MFLHVGVAGATSSTTSHLHSVAKLPGWAMNRSECAWQGDGDGAGAVSQTTAQRSRRASATGSTHHNVALPMSCGCCEV